VFSGTVMLEWGSNRVGLGDGMECRDSEVPEMNETKVNE
jgi:hypothetical protein